MVNKTDLSGVKLGDTFYRVLGGEVVGMEVVVMRMGVVTFSVWVCADSGTKSREVYKHGALQFKTFSSELQAREYYAESLNDELEKTQSRVRELEHMLTVALWEQSIVCKNIDKNNQAKKELN
ncbi:hypothetical protein N9137_00905 [Pseudomonadales bacterium]|nr:hypothetical protein [Pseudomonadales bacterium]